MPKPWATKELTTTTRPQLEAIRSPSAALVMRRKATGIEAKAAASSSGVSTPKLERAGLAGIADDLVDAAEPLLGARDQRLAERRDWRDRRGRSRPPIPCARQSAATGGEAAFVLPGVEEEGGVRPGYGSRQRGADAARCAGDHHHPFRSVRHDIPLPRSPISQKAIYQYTAFLDMESIQVPNSANHRKREMCQMDILIIGAGIGGLTLGLMAHRRGIPVRIFEAAPEIRPIGVGISILPHASKELTELGLQAALERVAVVAKESCFFNRFGQFVYKEPVGTYAGYPWPQFQIHRGDLQQVLYEAFVAEAGADRVVTGHRCIAVEQDANGATATFVVGGRTAARSG